MENKRKIITNLFLLLLVGLIAFFSSCKNNIEDSFVELKVSASSSISKTLTPDGQASVASIESYKIEIYRVADSAGRAFTAYYAPTGKYGGAVGNYTSDFEINAQSGSCRVPSGYYDIVALGYAKGRIVACDITNVCIKGSTSPVSLVLKTAGLKGSFDLKLEKDPKLENWTLAVDPTAITLIPTTSETNNGQAINSTNGLSITGSTATILDISGTVPAGTYVISIPYQLSLSNGQNISRVYQELVFIQAGEISFRQGCASMESTNPIGLNQNYYYLLNFHGNGATGSRASESIFKGETHVIADGPSFEKPFSELSGWRQPWTLFTSTPTLQSISVPVTQEEDIDLYADWADCGEFRVTGSGNTWTLEVWVGEITDLSFSTGLSGTIPTEWKPYGYYAITLTGNYTGSTKLRKCSSGSISL